MAYFLGLQNTYDSVELGLFSEKPHLIDAHSLPKTQASSELILALAQFLQKHQLHFAQLPFIVVNQGPGPFTTLRTVIATANGLSFASAIPLIGVDALE